MQQHAASFIAHTEVSTGAELPRFIKDEFDAFLERGILAYRSLRLRCGDCRHDKLVACGCMRRAPYGPDGGAASPSGGTPQRVPPVQAPVPSLAEANALRQRM